MLAYMSRGGPCRQRSVAHLLSTPCRRVEPHVRCAIDETEFAAPTLLIGMVVGVGLAVEAAAACSEQGVLGVHVSARAQLLELVHAGVAKRSRRDEPRSEPDLEHREMVANISCYLRTVGIFISHCGSQRACSRDLYNNLN